MSLTLAEALQQVDLDFQVGQSYQCEIQGRVVELRVLDRLLSSSAVIDESDAMLDAWVELPPPQADRRVRVRLRPDAMIPVDVPAIPQDGEERR